MNGKRIEIATALIGLGLSVCQAQTAAPWQTFQDRRGVALQIPQGWKGSTDPASTRISVTGPRGERLTVLPAFFAEPMDARSAAAILPHVAQKLDPMAAWNAPAAGGPSVVRMGGNSGTQSAVCSVTWVNSPRGAAAYFVLSAAPQA